MRNANILKNPNTDPALLMAPPTAHSCATARAANVDRSERAGTGRGYHRQGIQAVRVALLSTVALFMLAQMPAFADGGDGGDISDSGGHQATRGLERQGSMVILTPLLVVAAAAVG